MQIHYKFVSQRRVVITPPASTTLRTNTDGPDLRRRCDRLFFRLVDELQTEHIGRCQRRIISTRGLPDDARCRRNRLQAGEADIDLWRVAAHLVEEGL